MRSAEHNLPEESELAPEIEARIAELREAEKISALGEIRIRERIRKRDKEVANSRKATIAITSCFVLVAALAAVALGLGFGVGGAAVAGFFGAMIAGIGALAYFDPGSLGHPTPEAIIAGVVAGERGLQSPQDETERELSELVTRIRERHLEIAEQCRGRSDLRPIAAEVARLQARIEDQNAAVLELAQARRISIEQLQHLRSSAGKVANKELSSKYKAAIERAEKTLTRHSDLLEDLEVELELINLSLARAKMPRSSFSLASVERELQSLRETVEAMADAQEEAWAPLLGDDLPGQTVARPLDQPATAEA